MSKKTFKVDWGNITLVIVTLCCIAVLGCGTLLDHATPAAVDRSVTDYVGQEVPSKFGFTSLYFARQLEMRANIKHRTDQLKLLRLAQDDDLYYADAIKYIQGSIAESQAIQDIVVGSEGNPFSIMGLMAGIAPGLMVGRAMKRKGDLDPVEAKKFADDVEQRTIQKVNAAKTEAV